MPPTSSCPKTLRPRVGRYYAYQRLPIWFWQQSSASTKDCLCGRPTVRVFLVNELVCSMQGAKPLIPPTTSILSALHGLQDRHDRCRADSRKNDSRPDNIADENLTECERIRARWFHISILAGLFSPSFNLTFSIDFGRWQPSAALDRGLQCKGFWQAHGAHHLVLIIDSST